MLEVEALAVGMCGVWVRVNVAGVRDNMVLTG